VTCLGSTLRRFPSGKHLGKVLRNAGRRTGLDARAGLAVRCAWVRESDRWALTLLRLSRSGVRRVLVELLQWNQGVRVIENRSPAPELSRALTRPPEKHPIATGPSPAEPRGPAFTHTLACQGTNSWSNHFTECTNQMDRSRLRLQNACTEFGNSGCDSGSDNLPRDAWMTEWAVEGG